MKYYIYTIFLLLLAASCSDDVQKWDNWPEWKLASPLSVGGNVLDEEIWFFVKFGGKFFSAHLANSVSAYIFL